MSIKVTKMDILHDCTVGYDAWQRHQAAIRYDSNGKDAYPNNVKVAKVAFTSFGCKRLKEATE